MLALVLSLFSLAAAFTPYVPTAGYTYFIEAVRAEDWPNCQYRFASYPSTCDSVDMWNAAGINQEWTFIDAGSGYFYLKTSCGYYLSISGDCNSTVVDTWAQAGINQQFKFVVGDNTQFEYYIQAVGRVAAGCPYQWLSFPVPCTTSSPDKIDLWNAAGPDQRFRIHPVTSTKPITHNLNSDAPCADPFAWYATDVSTYKLQCTGGSLALSSSSSIGPTSVFKTEGVCLGGNPPAWASNGNRWAPENTLSGKQNYAFFADQQTDGTHRVGWAMSSTGPVNAAWNTYQANYMNLGGAPGGDIDPHVFHDTDGKYYLVWKTDDNNVGASTTRIWAQEITFGSSVVTQVGSPKEIMDSTGLWWVDSWVAGGSLVEGPEVVKIGSYYYLFFASGKYCTDSYKEGVARSTSIWGPYDKMGVPLLSNGIVGLAQGQQLVGPGHASYVQNNSTGQWFAVWHASIGENCNRYPFITSLKWGSDSWPYADF